MAEQKHPEAGRLRIRNIDGRTYHTVVEMADGAGGWTKVRGVTAVSWDAPGRDTFTRATLQIEAPLVDLEVRPYAVEQRVEHRGGALAGATIEAVSDALRGTWDKYRLTPTALELRDDFVAFAKARDGDFLSPDIGRPALATPQFSVLVGAPGAYVRHRHRVVLGLRDRHEQLRLEALSDMLSADPEAYAKATGCAFQRHDVPLEKLAQTYPTPDWAKRSHATVLKLPKRCAADAPYVAFWPHDAEEPKQPSSIAFVPETAPADCPTRGVVRRVEPRLEVCVVASVGEAPLPRLDPPPPGWERCFWGYGDLPPRNGIDRLVLHAFPKGRRQVQQLGEVWCRSNEGCEVIDGEGRAMPPGDTIVPLRTELVIHRGPSASERPKTRGRFGWAIEARPYGAALAGMQVQQICFFDPPETRREIDWFLDVARQRLVRGGRVVDRTGAEIPEGTQLLPFEGTTIVPQQPAMVPVVLGVDVTRRPDLTAAAQGRPGEWKQICKIVFGPEVEAGIGLVKDPLREAVDDAAKRQAGEIRAAELAIDTIPGAALQATEVGFGDPDPAPPAPEPERDVKPFDSALARALQKHRSL